MLLTALEKCRRHDKPVVMLKVGKTELGSKAASSHTGALAGNAAVYRSVFKQKNVITAEDVYELLDFSSFCANTKPVGQARVAIVTVSGGVGVLHADKCDECGLKVATLSEGTKEKYAPPSPPSAPPKPHRRHRADYNARKRSGCSTVLLHGG